MLEVSSHKSPAISHIWKNTHQFKPTETDATHTYTITYLQKDEFDIISLQSIKGVVLNDRDLIVLQPKSIELP